MPSLSVNFMKIGNLNDNGRLIENNKRRGEEKREKSKSRNSVPY